MDNSLHKHIGLSVQNNSSSRVRVLLVAVYPVGGGVYFRAHMVQCPPFGLNSGDRDNAV